VSLFVRTCQECGHKQKDTEPKVGPTDVYRNRKCKACKSEALDYGSWCDVNLSKPEGEET